MKLIIPKNGMQKSSSILDLLKLFSKQGPGFRYSPILTSLAIVFLSLYVYY